MSTATRGLPVLLVMHYRDAVYMRRYRALEGSAVRSYLERPAVGGDLAGE